MKKIFLSLLVITALTPSCKKIQEATTIKFDVDKAEVMDIPDIPHGPAFPAEGITLPLPPYASATDAKAVLALYNTNGDLIKTVKATELSLELLKPDNGNFNYIDAVKVYLSATGIAEQLVAYKNDIPKGTRVITATPVDVELKSHFVQDSVYFRIEAHCVNYPDSGTQVQVKAKFHIEASPLGTK